MERFQTEKDLAEYLDQLDLGESSEVDKKTDKVVVGLDSDLWLAIGAIANYFCISKSEYLRRVTRADCRMRRASARGEDAKSKRLASIGRKLVRDGTLGGDV